MDRIEQGKRILREEHRIKDGVDYALAYKYGKTRIICCDVYKDTIAEVFGALGLTIDDWAIWEAFQ